MRIEWEVVSDRISRLLSDVMSSLSVSETDMRFREELRRDGFNAAAHRLTAHTPKRLSTVYVADGAQSEFDLPDDFHAVEMVWQNSGARSLGEFLMHSNIALDVDFPSSSSNAAPDWYLSDDQIKLTQSLSDEERLTLFYFATWPEVSEGTVEINVPSWTMPYFLYYSVAYCLRPSAYRTGNIRQFNSRIDSGQPEHNPLLLISRDYAKAAEEHLMRFPPVERATASRKA